ncbi:Serine carboxypeptidase S28 family protein [Cladophialophora carrionii]|uniref:Serine carboxypeptidase S28 family protein n=1 Tax=Cladophialophora carrionii TaxID=86049 RepID=A0A1C1CV83_9EURO|nr:Serine carboxypeptidase S28 family protein [Cladophialophora carrionii]
MKGFLTFLAAASCVVVQATNLAPAPLRVLARQAEDVDPTELYPAHYLDVPVDHFHNASRYEPHSNKTFKLRYYFDATYYKPGGPVIVLQSGETDASTRLPYLQKGIVYQLASALNGIGVILEHRYYGKSFPTPDLSTKNLRFLSTDQAVADQAYFASNVVFPGLEDQKLTAPGTAYLAYGGSYSGGIVSFLRKLYPDIYWGAISSSGVTEALYDYWQYYEPVRQYGPPKCIANQVKLINILDNILEKNNATTVAQLKRGFGMQGLTHSDDLANLASGGIGWWQSRNWDPAVNSPQFSYYCGNITSNSLLWPKYASMKANATALISAGGWGNESAQLLNPFLNWLAWTNDSYVGSCDATLDECYNNHNASAPMYTLKNTTNYNSLSWAYQYCTEWGYIQDGASVPKDRLPLISRLLTVKYLTNVCRLAFNITSPPNVNAINKYGGFNISYPRLATVGGEADPWRPVTTLATLPEPDVLNKTSTASEPVILIPGAVHHWDENGLFPNETTADLPPAAVVSAQRAIVQAAQGWMAEWNATMS